MPDSTERLTAALEGRYRVLRRLGEGGMAIVYLAEDLKHHRQVALKILRPELAASLGPQRFLREIEIAARLTHPNILPLLDSGDADGTLFYVMPFVEGESLRQRLAREGQLPVDDAVRLAQRVATALGYAHSLGVVHRDIKPENILLSGGEPVVTDFGIAKAVSEAGQTQLTQSGFAVGTAPYMSPEQSGGERQLDGRSDLYSLGCVLYEMLAGAPPFTGPTLHAITARKLAEPVPPLRTVRDTVPVQLEQVVFKALARLPADRYATGQQLAEALESARTAATTPSAPVPAATPQPRPWRAWLPWGAAGVLAVLAGVMAWRSRTGAGAERALHLGFSMPPGIELAVNNSVGAISPDGSMIVFAAGTVDSTRLYVRRLDDWTIRPLPGTEGAADPFFSPDGRWIGFNSIRDRTLKKIAVDGGVPTVLCTVSFLTTGTWADNDTIYFTGPDLANVLKVPASGGAAVAVTTRPPPGSIQRAFLRALPGARRALVHLIGGDHTSIGVVDLSSGEERVVLRNAAGGRWVAPGYLVFRRPRTDEIAAMRFDAEAGEVRGEPATVARGRYWDVSPSGTLMFAPGGVPPDDAGRVVIADQAGRRDPRDLGTGQGPRFSPDGRTLTVWRFSSSGEDIWTVDIARGVARRETFDEGDEFWPIWSPDGTTILFTFGRRGDSVVTGNIYRRRPGGGLVERLTTEERAWHQPQTWARGGRELLFTRAQDPRTGMDIYAVELPGGTPRPILAGPANEMHPDVTRDGRFLAYTSDASGARQVFVRRYPDGADVQVSRDGGEDPIWSADGRQLYFRSVSGRDVSSVPVSGTQHPSVGTPVLLFSGPFWGGATYGRMWDVAPDGRHFVFVRGPERSTRDGSGVLVGSELRVVLGWAAELERTMRGTQ